MLKLKEIVKEYPTGSEKVVALKGVSVNFRRSEFVSILGQSGCGKTTLLNITGGLDQYTTGDLIIDGVSTKDYSSSDWDNYRNHRVGFVFQSYNLIPHQTVLANVELALTLSGVSKADRKKRAKDALTKVGLSDQFNKKPNQLSGGQMQRVAIARALVNDPEILLADEPTGALDSETSIQVMDILKDISKNKLVIMVTHNPKLAQEYSTRIIRLLDGQITDDSQPLSDEEEDEQRKQDAQAKPEKAEKKTVKKPSMSFFTALSLSLNNLMTKKVRTFLTSFAGSIGIIGIALILSLSNGFQLYIESIQKQALTSYPISIDQTTTDMNSMLEGLTSTSPDDITHGHDKVYSNTLTANVMQSFSSGIWANDLSAFKEYLDSDESTIDEYAASIQYKYGGKMNIYSADTSDGTNQVYPSPVLDLIQSMMSSMNLSSMGIDTSTLESYQEMYNSWQELIDNEDLLKEQYDLIDGAWPDKYNEVVLIVDKNNEISDIAIQGLGITTGQDIMNSFMAMTSGKETETKSYEIEYDDIVGKEFKLVTEPSYFRYNSKTKQWEDKRDDADYVKSVVDDAESVKIVGIIRPSENSIVSTTTGSIGYTSALVEHTITETNNSEIVKQQKANPDTDVFTGIKFPTDEDTTETTQEESTTKPSTENTSADSFETPSVTSLGLSGSAPKARATAETVSMPDFSSMPEATEEEVYAAIDKNYSGQDATDMKRAVELMLKDTRTISERKELIGLLDELLSQYEGEQSITGEQAYSYLSMMDRSTKLKMLNAMITGQFAGMVADESTTAAKTDKDTADDKQTTKKGETAGTNEETADKKEDVTETTQAVAEPEPEPLAQSYDEALELLGCADLDNPTQINIYPNDFEAKDTISAEIDKYNEKNEKKAIKYTDYIGVMLSSVTKIVNIISYVLIAFVAISLVVSSIMIGIITYISVLERTKEIGILRAIGASKRDISRVFNAETLIVGFVSGAIGIGLTLILIIPMNMIIKHLTTISNVAQLPMEGAVILILISMVLTFIAGLIPARIAARKDPVVALRTE